MHIRQFVRNTLVAINTCFTCTNAFVVRLNCTAALFGKVHEFKVVAVSAFTRYDLYQDIIILEYFQKRGVCKIMFTYLIMEGRVIWSVSSGSDMSISST